MTTATRTRLSLSALAAASSLIAITAPAQAQSICSAAGTAVTCTPGGTTTTLDATASLVAASQGLRIADTAPLTLNLGGTLSTTDSSTALAVQTTGGDLTIAPATGGAVNLSTTGTGNAALLGSSGNLTATLGTITTSGGGSGVMAQGATAATVTTGAITGTNMVAVPTLLLNSGVGAMVVATTGPATLTTNGNISVSGGANPLIGAFVEAPAGVATTAVNGSITVNNTAGASYGAISFGQTGATIGVTGPVSVTGTGAAFGLVAQVSGGSGPALVTAGGNVTAAGSFAEGIVAQGTDITISAPNATITATDTTNGTNAIGIGASAQNGLTINAGNVVSSGNGVQASAGGATGGALALSLKGVQAGTNGVLAATSGATPLTVTTTAAVTAANGYGISATGVNGLVTVTEAGVNGSAGGVVATTASGTGNVAVTATGGTTTSTGGDAINIVSGGSATTTVRAGATVTGQGTFDAIDTTSAAGSTNTVNIAGTVNTTGTGAALRAAGGPTTVNVQSGGTLNGGLVLTGGNDTLNVQSGGTFRPSGTVDFGAGTDTLNVQSGSTLQLAAGTPFTGLEVLNNAGALGLGTGSVSLAGLTTFTNTGTLTATSGASAITGLPTFTNAGTITMVDGAANDVLTLGTPAAPTNFVGAAGSRLAVDVSPTGADQLVITGNASGTTVIAPNFVGGMVYNPTGVTVVTTAGTVASGAFVIDPSVASQGFLNLGVTQTGGITRVTTNLDQSVGELASVRGFNQDMWYQSFDAYDDAVRGRHAGSLTTGNAVGLWGQLYRSRDRHDANGTLVTTTGNNLAFSNELKVDRGGAQVGLEYRAPGFVIGATGGYEWANNRESPTASVITGEGHNWGVYALAGMSNGLYAGVLYKRDNLDLRFFNPGRGVAAYFNDAHSEGVDGEIGLKGTAGAIGFDLQGGLSYVTTRTGSYQGQNLNMAWDSTHSLRGRLGGRVFFPQVWGAYLGAKVIHEFRDPAVFRITDATTGTDAGDIVSAKRGTWVRLEAGVDSLGIKGAMLSVWGDVGNTKSIGARVGFRF